jgi:acyl carrier protein
MDALELELKRLIVSALNLEDVSPEEIDSDEPLFGDGGLGLDSIDALELGVAIRKTYDIRIETVSDEVRRHFASISALAAFIQQQKGPRS